MLLPSRHTRRTSWLLTLFLSSLAIGDEVDDSPGQTAAIRQSVSYLNREVARWRAEHHCYACHHHGDGLRALLAATPRAESLAATPGSAAIREGLQWLSQPERWDENGPEGEFNDLQLARIQYAAALATAVDRGWLPDRQPVLRAAKQLAAEQLASGAWDFPGADQLGGPTTYGRTLATVQARRVLAVADSQRFAEAIRRADAWLRTQRPPSVIEAAATLWGLQGATDAPGRQLREQCRELLLRGQTAEGGWGPYVNSAAEPFDTALAVLALADLPDAASRAARSRGTAYLRRLQNRDGSWPETTRPIPRESYAQRLSTTAWATLALLTDD